jgi:hypothetical protein
MLVNDLLDFCKKGVSQGYRKRRRNERLKTPQADPEASTGEFQMQR